MKRHIFSTICIAAMLALSACTPSTDTPTSTSDTGPQSIAYDSEQSAPPRLDSIHALVPTTMAFGAPMISFGKNGNLDALTTTTTVNTWEGVEQLKARLINGEADIAATPSHVAANLYNKGIDMRLVGPVVWGLLYVLAPEGTEVDNWEALRGQRIAIPLPNNTPDLVFTYLLEQNKLSKDDLNITYTEDGQQAIALLMKNEVDWIVLPEHAATVAQAKSQENGKNMVRALDLQKEWAKVTGKEARFPMASLVMPGKLVDEHPELVQAVIAEVKAGVDKANTGDPETLKAIAEHYELPLPVVEKVLPRLQLNMVPARQARAELEDYLTRLGTINPEFFGGKLPNDAFYAG